MQWNKQAPPEVVAAQALAALRNASVPAPWRVFLATNCKDSSQIVLVDRLLTQGGASLVRYQPLASDTPHLYSDLPRRAFLEQLVASYAATFLYTASSFFSQTIVRERRRHARGPSVIMHGREQRMDFDQMAKWAAEERKMQAEASASPGNGGGEARVPRGMMGPGGQRKLIFDEPVFEGAALAAGGAKLEL